MLRVKLDTVSAAGYKRGAAIGDLMSYVKHAAGDLYDFNMVSAMRLPPAETPPATTYDEYAALVAQAAAEIPRHQSTRRPGLGDFVATALDAVGVTKERVQAVASSVGIKDCGCAARQDAMNKWSEKYISNNTTKSP